MKTKIHIDYDYDFCLIGIVCSEKDYRLCWALNAALSIHLAKTDDHEAEHSKHSLYNCVKEELFREYYLLSNRGETHTLIPEYKHIDYFLILKGTIEEDEKKHALELIKKTVMISAAYLIDASSLKSKQNLVL